MTTRPPGAPRGKSPVWPRPCPRSAQPSPWSRSRRSSRMGTAAPAHRTRRRATSGSVPRSSGGRPGRSRARYQPRRRDSRLRRPSPECACSSPHPRDRSQNTQPSSGARWVWNNHCSSSRYCAVDRAPCRSGNVEPTSVQKSRYARAASAPAVGSSPTWSAGRVSPPPQGCHGNRPLRDGGDRGWPSPHPHMRRCRRRHVVDQSVSARGGFASRASMARQHVVVTGWFSGEVCRLTDTRFEAQRTGPAMRTACCTATLRSTSTDGFRKRA